jgi:hypothetical protein
MVEIEISSSSLGFDPVVSLAVQASDEAVNQASKKEKTSKKMTSNQRLALSSLETVIKAKGIPKFLVGQMRTAVNLDDWRDEYHAIKGVDKDSEGAFRKAWKDAKEWLVNEKRGGIRDQMVWMQFKDNSENEF